MSNKQKTLESLIKETNKLEKELWQIELHYHTQNFTLSRKSSFMDLLLAKQSMEKRSNSMDLVKTDTLWANERLGDLLHKLQLDLFMRHYDTFLEKLFPFVKSYYNNEGDLKVIEFRQWDDNKEPFPNIFPFMLSFLEELNEDQKHKRGFYDHERGLINLTFQFQNSFAPFAKFLLYPDYLQLTQILLIDELEEKDEIVKYDELETKLAQIRIRIPRDE